MRKPLIKPTGFLHIQRTVTDMKRSIDFYVTILGFDFVGGNLEIAWLAHDNLVLTLSPGETTVDLGSYFGWIVNDETELERLYEQLFRGHQRLSAPPDADTGRSFFFVYDPDDNPIALSSRPATTRQDTIDE
jgi:catechol 2,3-dioxygenase-like lactoylglutathione lyase family enzyme